jgi:hypothetical protein
MNLNNSICILYRILAIYFGQTQKKKKKSKKSNISFIVSNDIQNFKNSRNALLFIITEKFIEKMKEVVAQVHMLYTSATKNKIK